MESKGTKIRKAILQKLKSLIAPLIILAIILAGVFIVINYKNVEEEAEPIRAYAYDGSEEPVILENDKLSRNALSKGVELDDIMELPIREKIGRAKYIPENEIKSFDDLLDELKKEIVGLDGEGEV